MSSQKNTSTTHSSQNQVIIGTPHITWSVNKRNLWPKIPSNHKCLFFYGWIWTQRIVTRIETNATKWQWERERERERERRGIENADLQNLDRRVLCQLFSIPSLNITGNQRYEQEKWQFYEKTITFKMYSLNHLKYVHLTIGQWTLWDNILVDVKYLILLKPLVHCPQQNIDPNF